MDVVETRTSLWEALAGRAPGRPPEAADPDLWRAIVDRLNPAKARPLLRDGIERVEHTSVRGQAYVMLRSPDRRQASYLRLTADEVALADRMDGSRTVAALVGVFAKISGRLAPDQVLRVVADLAANRMLAELPVDAFAPLRKASARRRPLPVRIGRGLLAAARGQRVVLADPDRAMSLAYRWGGRLLFTRPAMVLLALVIVAGLVAFVSTWAAGAESVFLVGDSYLAGALVLLALNVVALACHELGHALAAKHAGRRVPALGVLLYFGIPSAFVDTTDVWMAGRRARLATSLAGPIASLAFAGAIQLVALAYPGLGPLAFKLAFVWYLNTLFNLNPLMALDGYYALMDWLELPNLRPRAIATLVSWVRRRRPRWSELDREGRMIACYAVLAVLWLLVMLNLGVRTYRDRVSGIVVGLWHTGPATQLLLAVIVAGLLSPVCYAVVGWAGRRGRRFTQRRRKADLPRRVAALRHTVLRQLPAERLAELAQHARWLHPSTGTTVATAGAAALDVYAVADGTVEARRPGDPPGTIRARATAGELVGAVAALAAAPSALTWTTAGTRLLAMPAAAFTRLVGPLVSAPPAEQAEAESLLTEAPALAALSEADRLAMLGRMRAMDVKPGQQITVRGTGQAAVISSGTVALAGEQVAGRGALVGPPAGEDVVRATARGPVRLWTLPVLTGLAGPLAAGATREGPPVSPGLHGAGAYPPLAARPGPPPPGDPATDRRFLRRLRLLLLLVLLFVLFTGTVAAGGPTGWAEMPDSRVLLAVEQGTVRADIDGRPQWLDRGARRYLAAGDSIEVPPRSLARLTYRGGGYAVLCPATAAAVRRVSAERDGSTLTPAGTLVVGYGALLADSTRRTAAIAPLTLTVETNGHRAVNDGPASYTVASSRAGLVDVDHGEVTADGVAVPPTGEPVGCPGGPDSAEAAQALPSLTPAPPATTAPPATPSTTPSSTPPTGTPPVPPPGSGTAGPAPEPSPPPPPPDPDSPPPPPPPPPPPDSTPQIGGLSVDPAVIQQVSRFPDPCASGAITSSIGASARDEEDSAGQLAVSFTYVLSSDSSVAGTVPMSHVGGDSFAGTLGSFHWTEVPPEGGRFTIEVIVRDTAGNQARSSPIFVSLGQC